LDNRAELISRLSDHVTVSSPDVLIVAATYETWGLNSFANLIGDWALSIVEPTRHFLILAKDPIGTRHLYYMVDEKQITWSTNLEVLVLCSGTTFKICEEYIAGWFAGLPAAPLTPYIGVHAVPPSSFVLLRLGKHIVTKYWDFGASKRIRYRTNAEYEDHFRSVFATAVRRRLRSDGPILAELSGGMDSSSIVCMADRIVASGDAHFPRLDTISYYDDSDGDLNERLYFTKVEEQRGCTGYHINLGTHKATKPDPKEYFFSALECDGLVTTPNYKGALWPKLLRFYAPLVRSQGYRVTLSGLAGEIPTGGFVPTPGPELQNLLARGRFFKFVRQLDAWAAKIGTSRLHLLRQAILGFLTQSLTFPGAPKYTSAASWFQADFVKRYRAAFYGYPARVKLFGALPSFQNQMYLINFERRLVAHYDLGLELFCEMRFPYLDRDLLEFSLAIPPEQLVGLGQRRFLMKRALVGIVPQEILKRKRRAIVTRKPEGNTSAEWACFEEIGPRLLSSCMNIVNRDRFIEALYEARTTDSAPMDSLKRTLFLEFWLRDVTNKGVVTIPSIPKKVEGCRVFNR
jgi:asparagine synthase (glutamine-hydrolysing)